MARQAAKVKLNQHKGSLSAKDCWGTYTGVGGGSSAVTQQDVNNVAKVELQPDAAGQEARVLSEESGEDDYVAPMASALGEKPAPQKQT